MALSVGGVMPQNFAMLYKSF